MKHVDKINYAVNKTMLGQEIELEVKKKIHNHNTLINVHQGELSIE